MTKALRPMGQDPRESEFLRDLLEAGRDAAQGPGASGAAGYDFDRGLADHLRHLEVGTPPPDWAQPLTDSAASSAGGAAGAGVSSAGMLAWVVAPVLTLGVVATVMLTGGEQPPVPDPQPRQETRAEPEAVAAPAAGEATEREDRAAELPAVVVPVRSRAELAPGERGPRASRRRAARAVEARNKAPNKAAATTPLQGERAAEAPPTRRAGGSADISSERSGLRLAGEESSAGQPVELVQEPREEPIAPEQPAAVEEAVEDPVEDPKLDDAKLEREMRMLAVAQRVLHTDPGRSLRLARQGEREFPGSMFTQERRQVLLLALVKLGRLTEAKRLAQPYLEQYPKGPFSDRVRRALLTGKVAR